jgi:hypothetical protein
MNVMCGLDEGNKEYRILFKKFAGKWQFAKPSS